MKPPIRAAAVVLAAMIALFAAGCTGKAEAASSSGTETAETTAVTETAETEQETEPAADDEAASEPATELVTSAPPAGETTSGEPPELDPSKIVGGKPINPLTGLAATEETMVRRPVAIMINNIKQACPQVGISRADVIYEMMAEGGITRLMMLVTEYENLDVVGSVRSSREYYVDMAQNHDAIYIHAGGATSAYAAIQSRGINNIDGVNMYTPDTFYRDPARASQMGLEHSLMTSGKGIVSGINYKKYRTTLKDGFRSPLYFIDYDAEPITLADGAARHVIIPYNNYTFPQYIYRPSEGVYARYQFNGKEHIDSETGEILTFTNVIVIACIHSYTGDSYGHINIETAGEGDGYYFTRGTYAKIRWSKKSADSPIEFTYNDGSPVYLNCGKTFINVVDRGVFDSITLNYRKTK
jgi:hypothetical protein